MRQMSFRIHPVFVCIAAVLTVLPVTAQELSFNSRRQIAVPPHATFRLGPFHSQWIFSQEAGVRYLALGGAAGQNRQRTSGLDFPLETALDTRNYLVLGTALGLNLSAVFNYEYYPLGTEENRFEFNPVEEGVVGDISVDVALGKRFLVTVYEAPAYHTDYVDFRGLEDNITGQRYERFVNSVGVDADWLLARNKNLSGSYSRQDTIPQDETFARQESVSATERAAFEYQPIRTLVLGPRVIHTLTRYPARDRDDFEYVTTEFFCDLRVNRSTQWSWSVGRTVNEVVADAGGAGPVEWEGTTGAVRVRQVLGRGLLHELRFARGVNEGFSSGSEVSSEYEYTVEWEGDLSSVSASAELGEVESVGSTDDYRIWLTRVEISHALAPKLTLLLRGQVETREFDDPAEADRVAGNVTAETTYRLARDWFWAAETSHLWRQFAGGGDAEGDKQETTVQLTLRYRHQL